MNELMRAEQRHTDGIIAGAQADMARQTADYYRRRAQERDARYAAFQKAVADEEAARRAAAVQARADAARALAEAPHIPSGLEVLGAMEKAARSGDARMARVLGDAYRAGVGAVRPSAETGTTSSPWRATRAWAGRTKLTELQPGCSLPSPNW